MQAETWKRELKGENASRNVIIQAKMWKSEPKYENASQNTKKNTEMWKREAKCENVSQNVKMWAETWKREPKHENASQNMKMQAETRICKLKREYASQNAKMWAEMWKHEPKCENVSWIYPTMYSRARRSTVDLKDVGKPPMLKHGLNEIDIEKFTNRHALKRVRNVSVQGNQWQRVVKSFRRP